MKRTLVIRHSNSIKNILPNQDNINTTIYKRKLKEINIISVSNAIRDQEVNKVLNSAPHLLTKLKRVSQNGSLLAQLRSGYSSMLNSYLIAINASDTDQCSNCNLEKHTTNHLFNCPASSTDPDVKSLWNGPKNIAILLDLATE